MNSSIIQFNLTYPAIRKLMTILAIATLFGSFAATQTFADDHGDNGDRGHYHDHHGHHDKGHHYGERDRHYQQRDYNYYGAPVYVPAPVYYAPQPPAGVSLFFPLNYHN